MESPMHAALCPAGRPADRVECLHDIRVVRAPGPQVRALVDRGLVSWGIAFFEYWLAVPANRIGHQVYSAAQLKTMQEVITLVIFTGFSVFWLKEQISMTTLAGFALIAAGAALVFRG